MPARSDESLSWGDWTRILAAPVCTRLDRGRCCCSANLAFNQGIMPPRGAAPPQRQCPRPPAHGRPPPSAPPLPARGPPSRRQSTLRLRRQRRRYRSARRARTRLRDAASSRHSAALLKKKLPGNATHHRAAALAGLVATTDDDHRLHFSGNSLTLTLAPKHVCMDESCVHELCTYTDFDCRLASGGQRIYGEGGVKTGPNMHLISLESGWNQRYLPAYFA